MNSELVIVSAPSGAGKKTLIDLVRKQDPELHVALSWTTRPQRDGEIDGVDYFFTMPETFEAARCDGEFVECAQVHGNWYGTPRSELRGHERVLAEIDCQGARKIHEEFPSAKRIFILPASFQRLENQLRKRGRETDEADIQVRLANAIQEIASVSMSTFDHWIVNEEPHFAAGELASLLLLLRKGIPTGLVCADISALRRVQSTLPVPA